jgi:hypothetical protein
VNATGWLVLTAETYMVYVLTVPVGFVVLVRHAITGTPLKLVLPSSV